jgi:hypothetical protein
MIAQTSLRSRRPARAVWAALALAGCGAETTDAGTGTGSGSGGGTLAEGTNTGNGAVEAFEVRLAALTPGGPAVGGPLETVDGADGALRLDRARAAVREVRFQLPDGRRCEALPGDLLPAPWRCETGDDWVRFDAPFVVDLLDPAPPAALADAPLPALNWRRAEVRFADGRDLVPAGDPLTDAALDLGGTLGDGGAGRRFALALSTSLDVRFEADAGEIDPATGVPGVLLGLDVSRWFAAVPLTACAADADDPDEDELDATGLGGACADLEDAVEAALEGSGDLRRDDD